MEPILSTLGEKVDPRHTALVVVDVQNDFCADGGYFSDMGYDLSMIQQMVPQLGSFIARARGEKVPVVFVRAIYDRVHVSPAWAEKRLPSRRTGNTLCLSDTWGAELFVISPEPGDVIVTKHRYSAFVGTDLDLILRSMGVKTLLISGVATNVCVESTARDGYQLDYYVVFLEDCAASTSLVLHNATLENISRYFGVVTRSEDVLDAWKGLSK
ncbi:MAG: isochorismatase family cysteine hydrolase [Dehalococcoidia bacterium]|nr:isochorismatase family cysteine hydrolase [Dehalococcoidia bacterium]